MSQLSAVAATVVQFEHGPAAIGRTAGCGVDHAHLHLVPIDLPLRDSLTGLDPFVEMLRWRRVSWPWTAQRDSNLDYLFAREATGEGWIAEAPDIPSQIFRRAIARHLGHEHWNWRDPEVRDERARTLTWLAGSEASDCGHI